MIFLERIINRKLHKIKPVWCFTMNLLKVSEIVNIQKVDDLFPMKRLFKEYPPFLTLIDN